MSKKPQHLKVCFNLTQIKTNSHHFNKVEDYNEDLEEKVNQKKEETIVLNKETKNNNLNEIFENNLTLESGKETLIKFTSHDEFPPSGSYDQAEACGYMTGFPCIPNNYKVNGAWSGMVATTSNQIPFPSLNGSVGWQNGNMFYTQNLIPEESFDPFNAE